MSDKGKGKSKGKLSKQELMNLLDKYKKGQISHDKYMGILIKYNLHDPNPMEAMKNSMSKWRNADFNKKVSALIEKIGNDHLTPRLRKIHNVLIEHSENELKAILDEYTLIKKNRQFNNHLWVFDEKLLSSRRYRERSLAAVARSLNLFRSELDELISYVQCNICDLEKFIVAGGRANER